MIKKLSVLFLAMAFVAVSFAQDAIQHKAPVIVDAFSDNAVYNTTVVSGDAPNTAASYVVVDEMQNSFGPGSNTINPLVYDPIAKVLAVVHRGRTTYAAGSGELWWNWSTDFGTTWTRSQTSVQNGTTGTILGRYPSMTIFNPAASGNMADLLGAFSWPELLTGGSSFGNLGYGVSEGLLQSSLATIVTGTVPNDYSTQQPTFSDDQYVYWTSDFLSSGNAALRLFRTADYSTVDIIDPPTWNSARFSDNGNIQMGGVAYNGTVYVGVMGAFSEQYAPNGWNVGYSKSTDNGTTWSDWNIVDFTTIPSLGANQLLWDWKKGDTFISYSGDIQVDKDNHVHFVVGLRDTVTLVPSLYEIYETAPNVWAAKLVSVMHDLTNYETNCNGIGQMGHSATIATNDARDFFAIQYTLGDPAAGDSLADIYVRSRALSDANWSSATNLTETPQENENGAHMSPYIATEGGTDYIFSMYWRQIGYTPPLYNNTAAAEILVAKVPVRTSGNTVDITFNVDMGVQASKGQFTVGDAVKIAGNFNGWNNGADVLTDVDGDTVYTITKTFNVGDTLLYKFIKRASDWENDPNRQYVVPGTNSTVSVYFNNDTQYAVPTTINVTFSCNMEFEIVSGRFNPATDTLSVRGNFNGWGSSNLLFQSISDPNVYEGTFPILTYEGYEFLYKYAYFGGGNTTWENDPNKSYVVTADDITLGSAFIERTFNDADLTTITNNPVTIKFTVNMAGAISAIDLQPFPSIENVKLCGANAPLKWPGGGWPNADSTKTINLFDDGTNGDVTSGDNIWSRDVVFPKYSPLTIQYKYGANWGLPINGGGNDNENGVGADHFINLTPDMISATVENVFGTMGTHTLVNVVTDVEEANNGIPTEYALSQNYPNPFNPSTTINFSIPESGVVTLKVLNLLGQEVATLFNGEKAAGNYRVTFDASSLASGIYFYSIEANNFTSTRKMVLLK